MNRAARIGRSLAPYAFGIVLLMVLSFVLRPRSSLPKLPNPCDVDQLGYFSGRSDDPSWLAVMKGPLATLTISLSATDVVAGGERRAIFNTSPDPRWWFSRRDIDQSGIAHRPDGDLATIVLRSGAASLDRIEVNLEARTRTHSAVFQLRTSGSRAAPVTSDVVLLTDLDLVLPNRTVVRASRGERAVGLGLDRGWIVLREPGCAIVVASASGLNAVTSDPRFMSVTLTTPSDRNGVVGPIAIFFAYGASIETSGQEVLISSSGRTEGVQQFVDSRLADLLKG